VNKLKFKEIQVGLTKSFEATVCEKDIDDFIGISKDNSPIHLDDDTARSYGFKGRLVHGLLVGAFYSTLVGVYLPGKNGLLQTVSLKFRRPVIVGEKLTITGTVSQVSEAVRSIEIAAKIANADNQIVSTGTLTVGVLR